MKILKPNEVVAKTGLSRVTLWRLETNGNFPARINLTDGRVGWKEDEIETWIDSRPRGICKRDIKSAVLV